jgi:1-deoxy-D-xylulose-5-phosphate reductoisomerase
VKQLSILGSTGSVGVNTLNVVSGSAGAFCVKALAAGRNLDLLEQQIALFKPELVAVAESEHAAELSRRIGDSARVVHGTQGLVEVATCPGVDMVVSALVGAVGVQPTYAALEAGRDIALANKEALVVAGELMIRCAQENGARLLPVDSEHNALHQCLRGEEIVEVKRLWLTASGGPFRGCSTEQLRKVTPAEALKHPTWKMGKKISIDSATLMNKGLEVIEARWLFDVPPSSIRIVIHPPSIVHSMVEFVDGSFKAQLGNADMRHPIQYALTWPERQMLDLPPFDPVNTVPLQFEEPDLTTFRCPKLAYQALEHGGAAPAVVNAANEVAVTAFLEGRIGFLDIPAMISDALDQHASEPAADLEQILAADARTRATVQQGVPS